MLTNYMKNTQKNIYTIDQNHNFLRSLAKGILDKVGSDPIKLRNIDIYLPNRRTVAQLKNEFISLSDNKSIMLPKIRSIGYEDEENLEIELYANGFDSNIPQALPSNDRLFKLVDLIKNYEGTELDFANISFKQALELAYSLTDLIDDANRYQIEAIDGLENIYHEELASHNQISLEFLGYIFKEYPKFLNANNLVDEITKRNIITEKLAEIYTKQKSDKLVYIAGTTGTLPATKKLIKSIFNLKNGNIILPYIDLNLLDDEWDEIGAEDCDLNHQLSIKKLLEYLKIERNEIRFFEKGENKKSHSEISSQIMKPAKFCQRWKNSDLNEENFNKIKVAELNSISDEAQLISVLVKEAISLKKSCAVITSNKTLISYINSLSRNLNLNFDNSIGYSFAKTDIGKLMLNIADLISDDFRTTSLLNTLKSPSILISEEYNTKEFKDFINFLEKDIARKHGFRDIRFLINYLENSIELNEKQKNIIGKYILPLSSIIKKLDKELNVSVEILSVIYFELLELYIGSEQVNNIDANALDITKKLLGAKTLQSKDLTTSLFLSFSRIIITDANIYDSQIDILAPIESRLLNHDRVIIANANLGELPQSNFSMWLNKPMRRDFGLPANELEMSLEAHDFASLLQKDEVFITRSKFVDSEPTSPSPFLTRVIGFLESQNLDFKINEDYLRIVEKLKVNEVTKKSFHRPEPKVNIQKNTLKISATDVEKTVKNPYYIYAKEILKLKKIDNLEEPTERRDFGNFVHSALEEFANFHQQELNKVEITKLNDIFAKHYKSYDELGKADPSWILETSQISPWFIKKEITRLQSISKTYQEERGVCEFNGILLTGIADRIEIDKDRNLNIADYKTGKTPSFGDVSKLISPQLLIEMIIAKYNGFKDSGLSTSSFNNLNSIIYYKINLSSGGPEINDFKVFGKENLVEIAEIELQNLVESILDENTPFLAYPDESNLPEYDSYYLLARHEK